ncbi:MAG TPA: DnaA/Hda family protein, partial [Candidatus Nitrosopolaris sp.]|nr:DnaA/Hda family protein [Candidatus Nitrosopolaris sp.]
MEFDRGVTAAEIWEHGATALRSQLAPNTWGLWFEGVRAVGLDDDVLTLAVPSTLAADRIRSSYTGMLADTLRDVTGQQLRVELTVETDARTEDAIAPVPPAPTPLGDLPAPTAPGGDEPSRLWASGGLNPRYTFDQFVIGASNRFAHAAALSVAEAPARSYNPLFIYGAAGLGKTHLLHAIGHHVQAVFRNKRVRYVSTETFMNE